ncbi:MAG: hypothetical protein HQM11_18480 [SAR324 cluster bacterium]|nr:hypothetical protein [SAR324 cluster bacterium]
MIRNMLVLSCGLIWSAMIMAQPIDERCTQQGPSACIDWDRGIVMAEGIGAPAQFAKNPAQRSASAIRAAKLDAARNILEMIKGVNLSSATTMQDMMVTNDVVRTQVQGLIQGLRPVGEPRYFADGTIKVRMEARLNQTIPQEFIFREEQKAVSSQPPVEISATPNVAVSVIQTDKIYTGLIIDARGTEVQPAMSPKVLDEDGKEVYGSAYVDRTFVVQHGMAGYVKTLEQAQTNDRILQSPLVVKALRSDGANKTDLVIANSDAAQLRKIASQQVFLREARVVIVLD